MACLTASLGDVRESVGRCSCSHLKVREKVVLRVAGHVHNVLCERDINPEKVVSEVSWSDASAAQSGGRVAWGQRATHCTGGWCR